MSQKSNLVFLGCNYSNQKVKKHFDQLKIHWEKQFPIRVVIIDKQRGKGARDIWDEIKTAIKESSLSIFDVSAFKPNVVLELGYALAEKNVEEIAVTFDERKIKNKKPEWSLSDISHLNQLRYKELPALDQKLEEEIDKVPAMKRWRALVNETSRAPNSAQKYQDVCLQILQYLRDKGPMTPQQLEDAGQGTNVRSEKIHRLLKDHKLAKRTRGRGKGARWVIIED